jgi:glucose/arabinose dehydrogenase
MKTISIVLVFVLTILTNPQRILSVNVETVVTNLKVPWAITKKNNTFYLTERGGTIVTVSGEKVTRNEVSFKKMLSTRGEGGLLGFVLKPSSLNKGIIYYTYVQDGEYFNRVAYVSQNGNTWMEGKTIIDRIPGSVIHNGGRVKIGPDNKLYVTTGDAAQKMLAQNVNSLAGKILRLNLDGTIPEDNPFQSSYVYSYGHRNPQGLAWNKDGTKMYASEHGPIGFDEINDIIPGGNYGWPLIKGNETQKNMIKPIFHSGQDTWAPTGMAYKDRKLYVTALRGEKLLSFHLDTKEVETVYSSAGRLRDILFDSKAAYIVTSNRDGRGNPSEVDDRLIRLQGKF